MMTKSRLPVGAAVCGLVLAAFLVGRPVVQAQGGGPVLNPAQVAGPNVSFTWSAVAGATSYVLRAGVASGSYLSAFNVGNTTTLAAQAPAVGTYYVRVGAIVNGVEVPSNEISLQITSMFVPPAAPTNFQAYANGRNVLLTWDLGSGGSAPTGIVLYAGTTPGGSDAGIFPIGAGTQLSAGPVTPGTYYLRVAAVNQGGQSPASNEIMFEMPAGGACSAPPARTFTPAVFGRYVQLSWTPVPGAAGYRLDFSLAPGGAVVASQPVGPTASRFSATNVGNGVYYGRMTTWFSCGQQSTGAEVSITVDGAPPPGPRAPNPAPGTRLPLPGWGADVVRQLANERPDLLRSSCHEQPGGNNRFMFEAVRRLRARDNRFGLNWKRGNFGDLSQDIVNYNYGSEADEGTRQVYIVDIIGGHCGPNPSWAWIDQTEATRSAGTVGVWTLIPYLDAGYPIVSDQQQ
jgi:hypothetical protein